MLALLEKWWLWLTMASLATFIVSLVAIPWLITRIPADYFTDEHARVAFIEYRNPWLKWLVKLLRNALGVILLCGGFIMLFAPGQGLLTMAMGLFLLDYPGKFRLEHYLVSRPLIYRSLNWLRKKYGKEPLIVEKI